jgi:hypothetical protein
MSSNDFTVTITTKASGKLRFSVRSGNPPLNDIVYERSEPGLTDAIIEALRGGNADEATIFAAETGITNWLLSNPPDALFEKLSAALDAPEPVRLIFRLEDTLRAKLGQLPIELARAKSGGYLIFSKNLQSIVHLLPYDGPAQTSLSALGYPLRVLIVRSNPFNLGGAVPPALPICKKILDIGQQRFGKGQIVVDLLSRENTDENLLPTWDGFQKQVKMGYHLFVYLGHGDLKPESIPPVGVLQFEDPWGKNPVSVRPDQLKLSLQDHPIPVVLLVGCLTATQFQQNYLAEQPEERRKALLNWIQGNQGVAQALVESDSGVQLAVGMRYKLDTDLAQDFLLEFFEALLGTANRGNVEAAVREGRSKIFQSYPTLASWSAPVIYRNLDKSNASLGKEPMFSFLLSPPKSDDAEDRAATEVRSASWKQMAKLSTSRRSAGETDFPLQMLGMMEERLKAKYKPQAAALLIVGYVEAEPSKKVAVPIRIEGQVNFQALAGRITIDGSSAQDVSIQTAPEWKKIFKIANLENNGFELKRTDGKFDALPEGPMLEVRLTTGDLRGVVYKIGITLEDEPAHPVIRTVDNAIIVPLL